MNIDAPDAGLAGLQWMSRARLDQLHPPLAADLSLGRQWGPRFDQHVQYRPGAGRDRGVLLAFDPLWNEYAVLTGSISLEHAHTAVDEVTAPTGHHGHRVDALALYARIRFPQRQVEQHTAVHL